MPSNKDMLDQYLKISETEAIAFLESDMNKKQQEAYDAFVTRAAQIERDKDTRMQANQARYDNAIQKIQQSLKPSNTKTWSEYQAAEVKSEVDKQAAELQFSQTMTLIHEKYRCENKENEQNYHDQLVKLRQRFDDGIRDISYQHTSALRIRSEKLKAIKIAFNETISQAWRTYHRSEHDARLLLKKELKEAYADAIQKRRVIPEQLHVGSLELRKSSYEMVAKRLGLDGVAPDITSYVAAETPYQYDSVQPLLGYMDLKLALREAVRSSEASDLIRQFYDVRVYDQGVDVVRLGEAVQSLDLASLSQYFKHRCIFMPPPDSPEERTLYVDFFEEAKFSLTVVSPYGKVLHQVYEVNERLCMNTLREDIEAHTFEFINKLYVDNKIDNKARSFDAFSYLLGAIHGFKAHVIKTIATSNRSLKFYAGMNELQLTKRHISHSFDSVLHMFDDTPFHQENAAFHAKASVVDANYYAKYQILEQQCEDTIHKAKVAQQMMCCEAQRVYDSALEKIEHELAWDELAAELFMHAKAFDAMVHADEFQADVELDDAVSSEKSSKRVSQVELYARQSSLFSRYDASDSTDDEDREVCAIMTAQSCFS